MNRSLVSVIMSVYNTPVDYINESIRSILNQSYSNIQVVIVNDGDNSKDVLDCLQKYRQDDRVLLLNNPQNVGLTKSLNIAMDYCRGNYIARMDSDDIALKDRIETQVQYMDKHPEICMTGTEVLLFSDNNPEGKLNRRGHLSNQIIREIRLLFENTGYAHPTFMLRKSFLDENNIRYREDITKAQDYAMTTDCILAGGKRYFIEKPLLRYRIHDAQISNSSYDEQVECQAITAHRRIQATFKSLSDDECWAIARLNHERQDYSADVIISAIKKIFIENKKKGYFDCKLLEREFYYEYYRKVMRITRINRRPWGVFRFFFLKTIPSVISVKLEDHFNIGSNYK